MGIWLTVLATLLLACTPVNHHTPGRPDAGDGTFKFPDARDATVEPAKSCKDALQQGVTTDGLVHIDPDGMGGDPGLDVYCDMTTAGGGWMLVWSYGFTSYGNFTSSNNAVTPRPDWGLPGSSSVPVSNTTPTSPTTQGAMAFAQWRNFGSEVLITSTINHWIRCTPGTGSLVTVTAGSLTCEVVKTVSSTCTTAAPDSLHLNGPGPTLKVSSNGNSSDYYYFDGSTGANWPTHDPCGTNSPNQLKNVSNPGGAVYVR